VSDHDPLATDLARWARPAAGQDPLETHSRAAIDQAAAALRAGRRSLALLHLAEVRLDVGAIAAMRRRPAAERRDAARLEEAWKRAGGELRAELGPLRADTLLRVRPFAVRAIAEAALPHVKEEYEASLEYGRATMPPDGFFYLERARAASELVALCRALPPPVDERPEPATPSLAAVLDEVEGKLLKAYRPPASIDHHGLFIATSVGLKEARELLAAGLRAGALLRLLQSAPALATFAPPPPPRDAAVLREQLQKAEAQLLKAPVDDSLGLLFAELGEEELAESPPAIGRAAAIVDQVLPRYFAALAPARPVPPAPPPAATVTLVRWPYT
jgi:hypothetical protein